MRSTFIPTAAQPHQFEIRIAVLGYVSAGKTTVINALLRDQYGQVGMKRTTAGVNYFRLHHHPKDPTNNKETIDVSDDTMAPQAEESKASQGGSESEEDWSVCSSEGGFVPAAETLRVISDDNKTLRDGTSVGVKTFDVVTSEQLFKVRPDTRLVLVDIPGINEAGACGKYRAYVRDQWDTFDCVLVVMDGRHGANTEEHVKLLEFVRDNNSKKKDVSVIIVCNKVDDPDDLEQAELVKEAKEEVDRVFGSQAEASRPIFVPTSAEFAYIYRTAALMSFEEFRGFDKDLIDRLGRKEVGWKFSKLSSDEKFHMAYEFVSDMDQYDERIHVTNFNVVLNAIAGAVGGSDTQIQLIQKQIDVALRGLSPGSGYVEKIRGVFEKRRALGQSTEDLPSHFWETYLQSEDAALRSFAESPTEVKSLKKPLEELVEYCTYAKIQALEDECDKCLSRFKAIVVRQMGLILSKEAIANAEWATREATESVEWGSLHPIDWMRACQSVLLRSNSSTFCDQFGREVMLLDDAKNKWMERARQVPSSFGNCPKCKQPTLDFNGVCPSCKIFVYPSDCAVLSEVCSVCNTPTLCHDCGTSSVNRSGYCTYCGETTSFKSPFGFAHSTCVNNRALALFCQNEGCPQKLNENRFCDVCKVVFCFKDSPRSHTCLFCSTLHEDGRCKNQSCGGNKVTWKELPFASLLGVLSCEYDPTDGAIKPKYPQSYHSVVRLDVPSSLSDPNHFGHVAWNYCQFVESPHSAL